MRTTPSLAYIPDTQAKPDVPEDHLTALGNYLLEKQPDYWVHAGDGYDMPSCSRHKSALESEGSRIEADLEAGHRHLELICGPTDRWNKRRKKHNQYRPKKIVTIGNHEMQLLRYVSEHKELQGGQYGLHSFRYKEHGFKVIPFLVPYEIRGVWFSHYFANQLSGRPIGGNSHYKLAKLGFSFSMGHVQIFDYAEKNLQNGKTVCGLVAGAFYQHDEDYKGPQGNQHWRGIVMKHELRDGQYDLMKVSLGFLMDKYL